MIDTVVSRMSTFRKYAEVWCALGFIALMLLCFNFLFPTFLQEYKVLIIGLLLKYKAIAHKCIIITNKCEFPSNSLRGIGRGSLFCGFILTFST